MIVVMKSTATPSQVDRVIALIREMGLKDQPIQGTELTVVAAIGDDRMKDRAVFEQLPGVEKVIPVLAPYKRASVEIKPERSVIDVGPMRIGSDAVYAIAGPCSVESESQIIEVAQAIKAVGASALRGGAFKPRTNPYSFQGHGEAGLKMLATARDATGLPIVTEVISPDEVELVARYADVLQIGTRNAQNYRLLGAVGQTDLPVLFKRGMAMTLDEYLLAAEYILDAGNEKVILCERGIRSFEDYVRNTFALAAIPELKRRSHLPVLADPSHGTGHAHLVPAMSQAAIACGADALMIETHPDPTHALTDGAQTITPQQLGETLLRCARIATAIDRTMPDVGT